MIKRKYQSVSLKTKSDIFRSANVIFGSEVVPIIMKDQSSKPWIQPEHFQLWSKLFLPIIIISLFYFNDIQIFTLK